MGTDSPKLHRFPVAAAEFGSFYMERPGYGGSRNLVLYRDFLLWFLLFLLNILCLSAFLLLLLLWHTFLLLRAASCHADWNRQKEHHT